MSAQGLLRNGWNKWHLILATLLAAIGVAITSEAWLDIWHIAARDEENSHIFLVPIVFAWLVWVRRQRLRQCRPEGTWFGPVLVAVGWLVQWIGYNHAVQSFWHGGSLLVVLGCLATVIGSDVFKRFLPAVAVLVFLVPMPGTLRQAIAIPLQNSTAQITQHILELFGVGVYAYGNVLQINGVDVGIAEACNGLRMVFALVLVSYTFAYGTPLRWYVSLLILAASPLSAIVCNVIRLVPTVWLYGNARPAVADAFHAASGWGMMAVSFLALMAIIRTLRWALVPVTQYTLAYD